MKKNINLIIIGFLLFSCGHNKSLQIDNQMNIDELIKSWNSSTLMSIEYQSKNSIESRKISYEKASDLFKIKQNIQNSNEVNTNSIRYKFLKTLSGQFLKISDYFIVEADISGEYYQPRIFVIYSRDQKSTDVMKFEYRKNEWEFIDSFLLPYKFNYSYKDYISKGNDDSNRHNVIVSHIVKNGVERSDFFLTSTMRKFVFKLPESANHF